MSYGVFQRDIKSDVPLLALADLMSLGLRWAQSNCHMCRWNLMAMSSRLMPRRSEGPDQAADLRPFNCSGLGRRALPFGLIGAVALVSLAFSPAPQSMGDLVIGGVLLFVSGLSLLLPWSSLPEWGTVFVPLTYLAGTVMLILATGSSGSGLGILILAPVVWTALYHRKWESAVVLCALLVALVITSLTPVVDPGTVIFRRLFLWAVLSGTFVVAAFELRNRLVGQLQKREERLRQTKAVQVAAEELTTILDPDYAIERAVRLAAELASPPGAADRRAQYCRVDGGVVTLVAQYDETGQQVDGTFALEEHPKLRYAFGTGRPVSGRLNAEVMGSGVQAIVERLAVSNGLYVPVKYLGRIDGVLAVSVRGEIDADLFEQCKAIGHLLELALSNALSHRELLRSNAELEQFAYVASHDLSEPLRHIAGFTQLMSKRYASQLDAEALQFMTFILDGVEQMKTMIDDLLQYSQVSRSEYELREVDCNEMVDELARSFDQGQVIRAGRLPTVLADPGALRRVFQNLIGNGLKYVPPGRSPVVRISASELGQSWKFSVSDNGIGIAGEHRQRIFKLFQRLHSRDAYPGSGLGLAICQRIVERHSGRIWCDQNDGDCGGATFSFTLPCVKVTSSVSA
jgi:signal transduction histidine kinase